jgi:4-hydroxy-3-polyprenylbenzoate decarboxylase
MADHDLRSFLSRLDRSGQLQRVAAPVDPELESTSLCLRALR